MTSDTADAPKAPEARKVPSYMESLPEDVKDRITSLQEIQKKHDEIEAEFQKEKAALYAKYEKLYAPFYDQRSNLVNDPQAPNEASKGIPEFWLNALKSNALVKMQINEKDQEALKYIKDIKSYILTEPRGFKLEFHFAENPFFTNSVLTKEYHMAEDEEPILEKAIGTNIDWKNGKNLTVKLMRKKPKKGAKDAPPTIKLAECDSFFNFFKPPDVPDNDDDFTSEEMEDLQDLLEQDYDIGATIREKIIPHAVSWYTGEAEDYDDDEGIDSEDEEDYDEEDDDEEDEEEESEDEEDEVSDKEEAPALVKGEAKPE